MSKSNELVYDFLNNEYVPKVKFNEFEGVSSNKRNILETLLGDTIQLPKDWIVDENNIPITRGALYENQDNEQDDEELMINTNNPESIIQQQSQRQQFTGTFKSKNEWASALAQAYRNLGVSENGIKNLIAKNALESNWGKSTQGKFNYGNITTGSSWKGNYVNGHDHDAKGNPIRSKFRSYNSLEEFAQNEVDFLKKLYDFDDRDDINTFLDKLQGKNKGHRHYAESPKYKSSVKSVYNSI